jgi:hypothetical protein
MVETARADPPLPKPPAHYFSAVKAVLGAVERVRREADAEAAGRFAGDPEARSLLARLVDAALAAGKAVNDLVPWTGQLLNVRQLEVWREKGLERQLPAMRSLRPNRRWLGGILPDLFRLARLNAVKANAVKELADALVSDLAALLAGCRRRDILRPRLTKVGGLDRLLLVIDDFEGLVPHWGDFLVHHLLPALRSARFESVVVILGRDPLRGTHPGWGQPGLSRGPVPGGLAGVQPGGGG